MVSQDLRQWDSKYLKTPTRRKISAQNPSNTRNIIPKILTRICNGKLQAKNTENKIVNIQINKQTI
jgi:hypothetical protein